MMGRAASHLEGAIPDKELLVEGVHGEAGVASPGIAVVWIDGSWCG